ncbi:MAG: cyclase family protein [Bacteroidia bacterium]|nr:cyclase family protein [Bacteroidia bacterium]
MKYTVLTFILLLFFFPLSALPQNKPEKVSRDQLKTWQKEVSNWGRWGKEDQKGSLNLITAEKKVAAAALVQEGVSVSLAYPLSKEENINNGDPLIHQLGTSGQWAGDTYTINYHGYAHSHIDALCHIAGDELLYNGFPADSRKANGAEKLGIQQMSEGIFSRGILVDIPWLKELDYLEPGTPILASDLDAWEKKSGIKVESGDILLIRTGKLACEKQRGPWKYSENAAGLHASAVSWLRERDIAVLGSDGASDLFPSGVEGQSHPVHLLVLHSMGTPILDNLNLEDLLMEAKKQNRWAFLFTAAPLRIEGGTGSPLNPIAIF